MDDSIRQTQLANFYRKYSAGHAEPKITNFRSMSIGWESEVYAFDLHDAGASEQDALPLVLRIYAGADTTAKCERETGGMRQLAASGYSVPAVKTNSTDSQWFGQSFMIMERVEGPLFNEVRRHAPASQQASLLEMFCQLLIDLHRLDIQPFLPPEAATLDLSDPYLFLKRQLAEWQRIRRMFGITLFDETDAYLTAHMNTIPAPRYSVLHGDYHSFNILLDKSGKPYVIDWTNILVGDFRYDLAWTLLLESGYGEPDKRDVLLREYERLWGEPIENIAYYEVIACLRRLFGFVVSLSAGAEQVGMRADTADIMRHQIPHIRYIYSILTARTDMNFPPIERWIEQIES